MFQNFDVTTSPDQGPPRLKALRAEMAERGLAGYLVPRADAHQGEYVAPCDERLAWLTGFTGSAGQCVALADRAGLFVDGRYTLQARAQAAEVFEIVDWPATKPGPWIAEYLGGGTIGFDPWLHTLAEVEALENALKPRGIELDPVANLVDHLWDDRPARPDGRVVKHPKELAGKGDETKRAEIAAVLRDAGHKAAVLTLPDSICWLLNIRGSDIPRIPIVQAFAILFDDGRMRLYSQPSKFADLGPDPAIELREWEDFARDLGTLDGPVRVDRSTAPYAVTRLLREAGIEIAHADDPCILPKACKTEAEIKGTRAAHLRDAVAMCRFLAWLEAEAPGGGLTEIDVVQKLEGFRRAGNELQDISFETIAGAGPNGAIVHYRVNTDSNRAVRPGELLLVDSGGQYLDGTTDITRTVIVGSPTDDHRRDFTLVLKGMIAISRARWPEGLAGRDLDALARIALWRTGRDYDHGTGHGVGVYLSVHEGPQRLSRVSEVPLRPGMILSNEPGYYVAGAYGIRIENLVVVRKPDPGADSHRKMLDFETLTWVPIDRRLVDPALLDAEERAWLNGYHAEVVDRVGPMLDDETRGWLQEACAPL